MQDGEKLSIIQTTGQSSHGAAKIVIPSLHRLNVYRYQLPYKLFYLPGVGGWVLDTNQQSLATIQFCAIGGFFARRKEAHETKD